MNTDFMTTKKLIRSSKAEIVLIQESNDLFESDADLSLSREYPYHSFGHDECTSIAGRFSVFSKYPIVKSKYLPGKHGLFGFQYCTIRINKQLIQVVNVHLIPPRISREVMKLMANVNESHAKQKKEMEYILETIDKDIPTIIAGDFNSFSWGKAQELLLKEKFTDSFGAVNDNPDLIPTWYFGGVKTGMGFRIDYIFHGKEFKTLDSKVIKTKLSDHDLVVSTLAIKAAAMSDDN